MELPYKIILASNSPRRSELLGGLGLDFTVKVISGIDESWPHSLKGEDIPLYISREKAAPYKSLIGPIPLSMWTERCWANPTTRPMPAVCCA